jgi:hypothetical protein
MKTQRLSVPFAPGSASLALCEPGTLPDGIEAWAMRLSLDKNAGTDTPPVVVYFVPNSDPAPFADALTAKIMGRGADALTVGEIPPPLRFGVREPPDGPDGEDIFAQGFRLSGIPGVYEFLAAVYEREAL